MFKIYDGREHFWQWDLDCKLIVADASIKQVHFCNRSSECSLVCLVYEENGQFLVNVPNILLQSDRNIHAYAYDGVTKYEACLKVYARCKPADYVYTETEALTWKSLDDKINALGESTANSVKYTEQELTDEQKAQARTNIGAVSVDEVPKQVQSDWNQNDKKQLDYVKNRTHYTLIAHDSGYMADLMDSTHNFGDIILLRDIPIPILDMLFIPGINASYRSEYAFHIVYKVTFYVGTDVYEYENDKECIANEEMEISEFSTGNIKVLYHNKREPSIALYIIYDLTTLNDEDKTKFSKTGIYAQLVSLNAADTASSILVGYRSIKYEKLHSKYIDIPVATNDVAGVVKPVSKTDEMTQPVGVDENGVLFAKQVQTDWEQKDDTAADYLKNKPFGEGFPEDLGTYNFTATSETTITYVTAQDDGSYYVITHLFNHKDISNATQVVINGETDLWTSSYDGKGHVNASGDKFSFHGYTKIGNTATITSNANIFTTGNTYPVLFRDVSDDSIKKIGSQYIPHSVYTFENAPVKFGSGYQSTVQGGGTTASGANSHAEGYYTTASGTYSHAEGNDTTAYGNYSHAEGWMTCASSSTQHAQGICNVIDSSGVYAHIVGNGTPRERRNIHTLDWNGNAYYKGTVFVKGTNPDASGGQTVMANGDSAIILTSTSGKKFSITVDDSGTLSATEVTN